MQTRTLLSILSLLLLGVVGTFADVGADKADVESAAGNVMAARVCVVVCCCLLWLLLWLLLMVVT